MSQIETVVLKQGTPSKHVISACFFTMAGAYRKVEVYEENLRRFLSYASRLPGFEVRIYTDSSAEERVLHLAANYPMVTVIHYNLDFFREGKGHTGTFGTIVRFLPLFETGLETVWISDLDVPERMVQMNTLQQMKKVHADAYINTILCYDRKPHAEAKYPIIAWKFITHTTFPKQLLTRFLNKLMDGDFKPQIKRLNEYYDRKTPNLKFPYGIDELFINTSIYSAIQRYNLKCLIDKGYKLENLVLYNTPSTEEEGRILKQFYLTPTQQLLKQAKEIYRRKIPLLLSEYPCLQELYVKLDTLPPSFKETFVVDGKNL